jgi:hypothetical protein
MLYRINLVHSGGAQHNSKLKPVDDDGVKQLRSVLKKYADAEDYWNTKLALAQENGGDME